MHGFCYCCMHMRFRMHEISSVMRGASTKNQIILYVRVFMGRTIPHLRGPFDTRVHLWPIYGVRWLPG